MFDEVLKIKETTLIDKWFRISIKPFKTIVLNLIKKWSFMFKQHLMDDITNNLKELDQFIKDKVKELAQDVVEGDYEHLVAMMGHLSDIREKTSQFDFMFEPIKKKIELLKTYGQTCPDFVYEKLQVIFKRLKKQ